jgi:hypothetical protein
MYGLAAALGATCALLLGAGGRYLSDLIPEWVGQLSWLALNTVASAVCGLLNPHRAWRWGAIVIGVQPVCLFLLAGAVGELRHPTSSTGGMVAVAGFTLVAVLVSPLPILASHVARRKRARALAASGPNSGV